MNQEEIIRLQALIRAFLTRKELRKPSDNFDHQLIEEHIDHYNLTIKLEKETNQQLGKKKIRHTNLPSHISENIVKFAFYHKYQIMPTWDIKPGDLIIAPIQMRLEVKGSLDLSNGPPSFGPTESWDRIYFLDAKRITEKIFKVYEVKLSDQDPKWQNLKVSRNETFQQQCQSKRRPRMSFKLIQDQLRDDCQLIFNGHISELIPGRSSQLLGEKRHFQPVYKASSQISCRLICNPRENPEEKSTPEVLVS